MDKYQVIVGNIGAVYSGNEPILANKVYGEYKRLSKAGTGRAGNETVTKMCEGEIQFEHIPKENHGEET